MQQDYFSNSTSNTNINFIKVKVFYKSNKTDTHYYGGAQSRVLMNNPEGGMGREMGGGSGGGDLCISVADLCGCVAEANTIL